MVRGLQAVIVASPEVLGDNYEELVHNLNRLAEHNLMLQIVPPLHRMRASRN